MLAYAGVYFLLPGLFFRSYWNTGWEFYSLGSSIHALRFGGSAGEMLFKGLKNHQKQSLNHIDKTMNPLYNKKVAESTVVDAGVVQW